MRILKILGWFMLIALVIIQFFPVDRNESREIPESDFMLVNNVPKHIQQKIEVSCYDCHSNNTHYPWYNKIQPAAWYLENHIKHGKDELNFNEWAKYSNRRKNSKLRSIISQIEDGEMPLSSYTLLHRDARLSNAEEKELIKFMENLKEQLNNQ